MTTLLRRMRLARGQSCRQLGEEAGVSHATIHRLETGFTKAGRPSTRARLAAVLGVPIEVLLMPDPEHGKTGPKPGLEVATTMTATPSPGAAEGSAAR